MTPTISLALTINSRTQSDLTRVFDSLKTQSHDQLVIVLDRTPPDIADFTRWYWSGDQRTRFIPLAGEPGWSSPVPAYNAAIDAVQTSHIYFISSDTVQADGNLDRTRSTLAADPDTIIHGKAECSCGPTGSEVNWGGSAPGNLFSDAAHPRPLGFIYAAPVASIKAIGGYDPAFAQGLWFDDNDFFLRLWNSGADFAFIDTISGTHLHHDRPVLATPEGQAKIAINQALILKKHGLAHPDWKHMPMMRSYAQGVTTWRHI
jgi:hypothetical protein